MIKAVYAGNYIQQKEGNGKGKRFHLYNVYGSSEEMQDYINSPQFKKYPINAKDGTPQFRTMYIDALRDELPLYKKQDGNYTLDGSETGKDVARIEALASISPALEAQYAARILDKAMGPVASTKAVSALFAEPVSDGTDADITEM
jgi:hypothetical protein